MHGVVPESETFCRNEPSLQIVDIKGDKEGRKLYAAFDGDRFVEAKDYHSMPITTYYLQTGWKQFAADDSLVSQQKYTFDESVFLKDVRKIYSPIGPFNSRTCISRVTTLGSAKNG